MSLFVVGSAGGGEGVRHMPMDALSSSARVIWVRGCETGERRGRVGWYFLFQPSREHEGRRVPMLKERMKLW
jgi:hypothetical protein